MLDVFSDSLHLLSFQQVDNPTTFMILHCFTDLQLEDKLQFEIQGGNSIANVKLGHLIL